MAASAERPEEDLTKMPMWKSYLYHLQQQAPHPKRIVCQREIPGRPPHYGKEYHGAISREDADFMLTIGGEGSYLIRESLRAPGQYTLAIRFDGVTKNFKLYFDGQHYVGEKRFDQVHDLVADGLITFYLESKAADYIAALSSQSNYAESPYVAYNTHKRWQVAAATGRLQRRPGEGGGARPATGGVGGGAGGGARAVNIPVERSRLSQVVETRKSHDSQQVEGRVSAGGSPGQRSQQQGVTSDQLITANEAARVTISTNTDGPMLDGVQHSPPSSPLSGLLGGGLNPKASSVTWCTDFMQVMGSEKSHCFKPHTFKGPHWCDFCANFLWGLIAQGVKCQEKVPSDCMPDMKYVKRMFGVDLTTLVKAQNTLIPAVVEQCIKEIEARGMTTEGLYRLAGFHDDVEAIKMAFDKDGDQADITRERYDDVNTVASVLKLYFRLLPIPLITFDIYFKVIDIIRREDISTDDKVDMLHRTLLLLAPAHYHTLKYLMNHLHRVADLQNSNMMNAENIAIVFAPTLLRSPETDPLISLSAVKYERELIELLVIHHNLLFD